MIHDDILVSFIIPMYNAEKYLERCLSSVTAIKNNRIEIIVIDDGSTDQSSSIYKKYAEIDNRILIIKKENGGVSSARNKGIEISGGEWVTFIDSDDEIDPSVYDSILLQLNNAFELWMLGVVPRYIGSIGPVRKKIHGIWSGNDIEVIKRGIFHQDMKLAKKIKNQGFDLKGPIARFYKKEIIIENNILFPENIKIGEDCIFNYLYLNYVKTISYTNESAYYYWQNDDSVMHKFCKGYGEDYLTVLEKTYDILKQGYLLEYAQFGVRQYLHALKSDWCNRDNHDDYFTRKREAMQWREKLFVQEAFQNLRLLQIRWEAIPIAYCAKVKCFFLCNLLLKTKERLHIKFK